MKEECWNLQLQLWMSTSPFSSISFCYMYFVSLLLSAYLICYVLLMIRPLYDHHKMSFLFPETLPVPKSNSSDSNISNCICWFMFAWCICFQPFTLNLSVPLYLMWIALLCNFFYLTWHSWQNAFYLDFSGHPHLMRLSMWFNLNLSFF